MMGQPAIDVPPDKMLGEVQQHLWNLSYQEIQPESNQAIDQTLNLQEMQK